MTVVRVSCFAATELEPWARLVFRQAELRRKPWPHYILRQVA
jgi:hypothetical protein